MKAHQLLSVIILLSGTLLLTKAEDDDDPKPLPHDVRASTGIYINAVRPGTYIYSQTIPIIFTANFTFPLAIIFDHQSYYSYCKETNNMHEAACLVLRDLMGHIMNTEMRLKILQEGFTNLPVVAEQTGIFYNDITNTVRPPDPSVDNTLSNHTIANDTTSGHRQGRQVLLGALGAAAGYKLYEYFFSSTTAEDVYSEMKKGINHMQTGLIRLAKSQASVVSKIETTLTIAAQVFNKYVKENQEQQENIYKSLHVGELRTNLLITHMASLVERLTFLVEYESILSTCKESKLPMNLVPPAQLAQELAILSNELTKHGLTLVIPYDQGSPYYHFPLAHCQFNPLIDKITIVMEIPIKRKDHRLQMIRIKTIPFVYNDQICRIKHSPDYIVLVNKRPIVVEGAPSHKCNPHLGYCFYEDFGDDPSLGSVCTRSLVSGLDIKSLIQMCPFECRKGTKHDVVVTLLDEAKHMYAVTNLPKTTTIQCFEDFSLTSDLQSAVHKILDSTHPPGSFLISLPCSCKIVIFPHTLEITPPFPCRLNNLTTPVINLLIPYRWTKFPYNTTLKALSLEDELYRTPTYLNHSVLYNPNWHRGEYVFNYTKYKFRKVEDFGDHVRTWHEIYLLYLNLIWNFFITLILFTVCCSSENLRVRMFPTIYSAVNQAVPIHGCETDIGHKLLILFISVGLLDILLISGFLILLYFYFRIKWTKSGPGCIYHSGTSVEDIYRPATSSASTDKRVNKEATSQEMYAVPTPHRQPLLYPNMQHPILAMHHQQQLTSQQTSN